MNAPLIQPNPSSAGPPGKKRRLRIVPLSLALLALLVVAMVGYWWFVVRPWTAPPDVSDRELAALWEDVVRQATTPVEATGPPNELKHALKQLAEAPELEEIAERWREKGVLDDGAISALQEERDIGERLVRWMKGGGGIGTDGPCTLGEDLPALELFLLGRVALTMAGALEGGPSREERLRSVLRLSMVMRRGGGPVHLLAGLRLAEHVAAAAKRMEALDVLRAARDEAPREAEIWRAVNVDAYCADELLERNFGALTKGWPPATGATENVPRSWIDVGPTFFRRERAMVRWWMGQRLRDARPVSLNPPRLAEALRLPEDLDDLPKSLLVRLLAADLADPVIDAGRAIESYRETVGMER